MTKRIGVHLGTPGGASNAVARAREIGANTFQFFSASPRMWKAPKVDPGQAQRMREQRAALDVSPLVIHASYLINVCSQTESVRAKLAAESITQAIDGLAWQGTDFHILIENTAGAEFSLGGSFDQVAELVTLLKSCAPVGVCLDTCHSHVAGYDLVSEEGYAATMDLIGSTIGFETVRVWHSNDAKAERGCKLDRHEHIGQGTMGVEPFRRLLNDPRFSHAAFIAETPVDEPGDDERNVRVLKSLLK
jgi:deoxyribonuclease-4